MVAATKPAKAVVKLTTGAIIDSLWQLREDKKKIAEEEKRLNGLIDELEMQLFARMDSEDSTRGAGKYASVSLGTQDVVQFIPETGFDDFTKYVLKTKQIHLLERRPSQLACQEVIRLKGKLPGCQVFTKRKINLTTTPSK